MTNTADPLLGILSRLMADGCRGSWLLGIVLVIPALSEVLETNSLILPRALQDLLGFNDLFEVADEVLRMVGLEEVIAAADQLD
jgi:hypothetical protein